MDLCCCCFFLICEKKCPDTLNYYTTRERIRKFRETGKLKHLYRNKADKACFAHDAAYSDNKDFADRYISDKILKDRA